MTRLRRAVVAAALGASLMVAGCAVAPDEQRPTGDPCGQSGVADGTAERTLSSDGTERSYVLHVPPSVDTGRPTPVVLLFHGLDGSAAEAVRGTQMGAVADDAGFAIVAPQGLGDPTRWDYLTGADVAGSDRAFVDDLVRDMRTQLCVDDDRVYAAGFSNGSALALALACEGDGTYAAFAGVSAPLDARRCGDAPPASILYFHGDADPVVPIDGIHSAIGTFPPAQRAMESWARHDGCDAQPQVSSVDAGTHTVWADCAEEADLEYYEIHGGGHRWPGGSPAAGTPSNGALTQEIDASRLIARFFADHPRG